MNLAKIRNVATVLMYLVPSQPSTSFMPPQSPPSYHSSRPLTSSFLTRHIFLQKSSCCRPDRHLEVNRSPSSLFTSFHTRTLILHLASMLEARVKQASVLKKLLDGMSALSIQSFCIRV